MFDLNIQCAVANYDGSPKIQKTNLYIFKTFIIILNDCIRMIVSTINGCIYTYIDQCVY